MPAYEKADLERRMHGAVESLKHDLGGLRTGRASASLLDPVTVEVYGAHMPLNQVATVSVPEPRMISVQVWDKSNVGPADKAMYSQEVFTEIAADVPPGGRRPVDHSSTARAEERERQDGEERFHRSSSGRSAAQRNPRLGVV